MTDQWLKCKILKGMFSDESTMVYPAESATASSFFVPKEKVRETDGAVHVRVFREGGTMWAIVPAESQPVIQVNEKDLTPSA
ncbi:MAG: hypothetical protein ISS78_07765 [Phycisphaerae bacterium]|nr:hypothetical protein [Planctomycetota bacterium]MBL7133977.1 hypothetical protein [Phycisphaerae bacterium]